VVAAWVILKNEFESSDPSRVGIVRLRYEHYHMIEGQSVSSYLTTMREYRNQLYQMGEKVPDSTHASIILQNLPKSWQSMALTIQMMHTDLNEIEQKLKVFEANLGIREASSHTSTAFTAKVSPQN
jgi:gag-polypeptide of LTR copia-type